MNKQDIVALLQKSDKAVARALVVLNERQTADEQASEDTRYLNGRGFRPCHARMGTSMAKFYTARGYLTAKQIAYWRKPMKNAPMKIAIYAGQLLQIAAEKAAAKTANTGSYAAVAAANNGFKKMNGEFVPIEDSDERMMQRLEAEGDRAVTLRDETNKAKWKAEHEANNALDCASVLQGA